MATCMARTGTITDVRKPLPSAGALRGRRQGFFQYQSNSETPSPRYVALWL